MHEIYHTSLSVCLFCCQSCSADFDEIYHWWSVMLLPSGFNLCELYLNHSNFNKYN